MYHIYHIQNMPNIQNLQKKKSKKSQNQNPLIWADNGIVGFDFIFGHNSDTFMNFMLLLECCRLMTSTFEDSSLLSLVQFQIWK